MTAHSIPVVHDLPGVGAHLMDHPAVFMQFRAIKGASLNFLRARTISEQVKALKAVAQYKMFGTGPLTTNVGFTLLRARASNL